MTRIIATVAFLFALTFGSFAAANPPPPPPTAPVYVEQRNANGPSYHSCREIRLHNGQVILACNCYGRIDCKTVRPACTPVVLASDRYAARDGRCVMPRNAPPQG